MAASDTSSPFLFRRFENEVVTLYFAADQRIRICLSDAEHGHASLPAHAKFAEVRRWSGFSL